MADLLQWYDELNLLQSEKKERIETAKSIQSKMSKFFKRQRKALIGGDLYLAFLIGYYDDELFDIYMSYADSKNDEYMVSRAKRWAQEIENTTKSAIESVAVEPFTANYRLGKPIVEEDIPEKVLAVLSDDRATRIALHEPNVIHNHKRHEKLKNSQLTHTWETMKDERVRLHHSEADGQTVPIDMPFVVNGEQLMFPGDDSLGASPDNIINCRCIEL